MDVRKMFDLTGRVAVVTGGAGAYGKPLSEALAEAGAHVIVASRDRRRCETWTSALVERGLQLSADAYDQSDEKSILAFRNRALAKHGSIDILVNNSVARPM